VQRSLNKVMLIGQLGRDPEMRYTAVGDPVTAFSLATTRTWATADGEHHEAVDWFNVIAWHHLAEVCSEQLRKGSRVFVEGRLQTRSWQDDAGDLHYRTEIVATEVIPLEGETEVGAAGEHSDVRREA
jgi:single-strand DNA-binding protein